VKNFKCGGGLVVAPKIYDVAIINAKVR